MTLPNSESSHKSPFSRDVFTLVTGTTIALIITLLASPLITRLYGPEAFGLAALFTSITDILAVVACLRYELAILDPKSDEEAANVFGLCMIIVIVFSIILIPVFYILQQPLTQVLKVPLLGPFFWLIVPTVFVSGTFLALNYWNTRTKNFGRLSIARVTSSCSSTVTQLGAGFLGYASGGALIGAKILGQIISTTVLGIQILIDHLSFFKQTITLNGMIDALKKYSNFPKYDIWSALLNSISWQIPLFSLSYFFSTTIVGYYSLGMMVIQLPMSIIGGAIAQVFFQRATEAQRAGLLAPLTENLFNILVKIGMFPLLILACIGQDLFIVVFGSAWGEAGVYIQVLSLWAIFWFFAAPLSSILIVLGKLKLILIINILALISRIPFIIIGGYLGSAFLAICLFSLSGVFLYGIACFLFLYKAGISVRKTTNILASNFLIFLPAGIILLISDLLFSPIHVVIIAIAIFLLYYFYLFKSNRQIQELIIQITNFLPHKE